MTSTLTGNQDRAASTHKTRPISVYMMDLLPTVPYYTGSLCASLGSLAQVEIRVGCIPYYLDRGFFDRLRLKPDRVLLDAVSHLRGIPAAIRRVLKLAEYLTNLSFLLARFGFSRPDLLHVQFLPTVKFGIPVELWFIRAVRLLGCQVVYTVHNVLPQDTGERHRDRYQRLYRRVDRLICHDECSADRLVREFQVDKGRISIIPHGPLLESPSPVTAAEAQGRLELNPNEPLVLCQGILRPYKGIPFLLEAWRRVQSGAGRGCLAVVGSGDQEIVDEIRSQVASLGIASSVHLDLRFVSVDELADYYTAATVLVYPYREVTTSGALMTGINYGKAIVATRQPAFQKILCDGENALMVDYGDVDALAERIQMLMEDPALRTRLGERARINGANVVQWPEIAKQTLDCYEAALAETRQ
jgi:glycosyltransferase involved in cell wall biosynthesis